jgi:hypothetical protein
MRIPNAMNSAFMPCITDRPRKQLAFNIITSAGFYGTII